MSDSSPISGDTPSCSQCGKPLSKRDEDRSTCNDCRSARGKLADLDIAIRASGDDPKRLPEWIDIQHFLRKRFGEQSDLELWYRFRGWLSVERGFSEEEYLLLPLDEVKDLLADESAFIETAGDLGVVESSPAASSTNSASDRVTAANAAHRGDEAGATTPTVQTSKSEDRTRWLAEAMLLVRDNPEWSNAKIAKRVRKSPSTLSRSPEYQSAAAMARGDKSDLRRGHVTVDPDSGLRDVEAYSNDPAERDWDD